MRALSDRRLSIAAKSRIGKLFLLLSMLMPSLLEAATEEFEIVIPAQPEMSIYLQHSFGNLEVRPGKDDQLKIVGSKLAESENQEIAEEFLDKIELSITRDSNLLSLETVYPNIGYSFFRRNKITNRGMSYAIEIPVDTKLSIDLKFGNIDLNKLHGDFKVEARQASVRALELQGDVSIADVYGSIVVESISGAVIIDSDQTSVNVKDVSGSLTLTNKFGSTEIRNIQGDVKTSGEITPIVVDAVGGNLAITSYASTVFVNDVDLDVEVQTKETEVIVTNIQGSVIVGNTEGRISIDQVGGNVNVKSAIGPVTIRNANEDIIVEGRSSDVILEQVYTVASANVRRMDLTTSLGFLKLDLPAELSAILSATTVRRPIHANFPVYLHDSPADSRSISAEFGDKKDSISITGVENVEITLTKL